jgi:enterochelin esterase-like enzyme
MRACPSSSLGRRELLRGLAAIPVSALASSRFARADTAPPAPLASSETELDTRELVLAGDPRLARRTLVLTPRRVAPGDRFPVVVLLHGLGETWDDKVGVRAWSERYGLLSADARLRRPPLTLPAPSKYLGAARLDAINAELVKKPYRGAILVCPFTPNVHKLSPEPLALDRYANWLVQTLLPAVRESAPAREDAASTAIDGCSLGGYMALEIFLRKPEVFGAVGCLQPAISERMAPLYAQLIRHTVDRVGPRGIHVATSNWDPDMPGHEALARRLGVLGVPHDYDVLPGGHDQVFLRERGTLETLLWHDRRFPR